MKYRLAVFDMDGTILNTIDDLHDSLNYVLRQGGYRERTFEEVVSFVGNGLRMLIKLGLPEGCDDETIDSVLKSFKNYYALHCADKTAPYDGIKDMINNLRAGGCLTAVVSNKADDAVAELCEKYFPGMFDYIAGEKAGIARKPSPEGVEAVLEKLGVLRGDAVYIGDSEVDIKTAENALMDSIIVDWGFRKRDFLEDCGAKVIVSSPQEIEEVILK